MGPKLCVIVKESYYGFLIEYTDNLAVVNNDYTTCSNYSHSKRIQFITHNQLIAFCPICKFEELFSRSYNYKNNEKGSLCNYSCLLFKPFRILFAFHRTVSPFTVVIKYSNLIFFIKKLICGCPDIFFVKNQKAPSCQSPKSLRSYIEQTFFKQVDARYMSVY